MKTKDNNIGILGYGEVGRAIAKFYNCPKIKDVARDDDLKGVEVLHICIPYNKDFIGIVKREIKAIKPQITIIHTTTAVGTTEKIGGMVVHSPIRGVHPKLYAGINTFVKYVGADDKKTGMIAKKHLEDKGIEVKIIQGSRTTEAMKLWSTTQYAWSIVLEKEIKKWCYEQGLDFDMIYTEANKTYNQGFQELGKLQFMRPVLKHMEGKIGGHCQIPNCKILDSDIAKYILKKNKGYV